MRLRSLFKTSLFFFGLCFLVYIMLYMQAGHKEATPTDLVNQFNVVQKKGYSGLKMEWLHYVSKRPEFTKAPAKKPVEHSSKEQKVADAPKQRQRKSLQMSQIYEELEFVNTPGGAWTQGFPISYNLDQWAEKPLEVFLVPHSHQDPGWVMTLEEYFRTKTKKCLDSTLKVLESRPDARFSYAEISFFSMWVAGLTEDEKNRVKKLLNNGQLEVVSGGWVMTDEAAGHHYAMLDQLIEGHQWLLENFDYRPNVSWSIDPFGHSPTMAYLNRKMRFSAMVLQRVHYEVKKYLAKRQSLEFSWRQYWDNNGHTEILAHMMPFYSYDVPHTCGPEPAVCCQFDFARLQRFKCPWKIQPQVITQNNVAERARLLADQYRKKAMLFDNDGLLLVPLGDDFRYLSEEEWGLQMDNYGRLIQHFNSNPEYRIKVRFATVSDYFNALHQRLKTRTNEPHLATEMAQLTGDLFTYADRDHDYWSGYFTSRPAEKSLIRHLESELRSAELLYSYTHQFLASDQTRYALLPGFQSSLFGHLTEARRTLGLLHHHDAITGTAKPLVASDYVTKLLNAIRATRLVFSVSVAHLLVLFVGHRAADNPRLPIPGAVKDRLESLLANTNPLDGLQDVSSLEDEFFAEGLSRSRILKLDPKGSPSFIYLFNPVPYSRTLSTTLTLQGPAPKTLLVTQSTLKEQLISQRDLIVQLEPSVQYNSPRGVELFTARIGPVVMGPMSLTRLSVQVDGKTIVTPLQPSSRDSSDSDATDIVLSSDTVELRFDAQTGLIKQFIDRLSGLYLDVLVDFVQYHTAQNKPHSGAYIFVPEGAGKVMELPKTPQLRIVRGPLCEEITVYTQYVNHTVRLYKDARYPSQAIELQNTVDLCSTNNMELVMRVRTNISSAHRTFFTDSNCFQFIQRTYYDKLPLQGNLYPMTCAAFVEGFPEVRTDQKPVSDKDPHIRLSLLTAHAHGVTSTNAGELMVWLDRRTPQDDDRGVESPLVGSWITESRFVLHIETLERQSSGPFVNVPRLSLPTYRALTDLLRPVQRIFISSSWINLMPAQFALFGDARIPCDYELLNLKTYHSRSQVFKAITNTKGAQIGLILHRLAPFVKSSHPADDQAMVDLCESSAPELDIKTIFAPLKLSQAAKLRRLTMIPEPDETLNWHSSVTVEPMELETFLLN
ncbi:alpha-mannosidase II [Clonorchis sinensis]|uniref:mannosyl-oligosaccharide 1,3-1,6-alpha-mannosidase n=1 Tax=Clonorchis sinensis TaxID=79923 RepID=G7Y5S9_CLOSI|nr:alpha-mannosidase II [Clonorchis sinensis]